MALMSDIVHDVLVELRFGAGQDVQIHIQEGIVANVSRLYRTLMTKHIWRDYHSVTELVTSAVDGQVTTDISDKVTSFRHVLGVFLENSDDKLPVAPTLFNPLRARRPMLVATGGAKVFAVYPKQERNIVLFARKFEEDNFDMEDDVPFYRDVLAVGAASMLMTKTGTNDQLAKSLEAQFQNLLSLYVVGELQDEYQTSPHRGQYPNEWYVDE